MFCPFPYSLFKVTYIPHFPVPSLFPSLATSLDLLLKNGQSLSFLTRLKDSSFFFLQVL